MEQQSLWVTTYLPLISTVVVAVATLLLVWLTSRYVRLTGRMVEEAQKSREPSVTVDFEIPDDYVRLVIENHGLSPAKNVRITVLKNAQCLKLRKGLQGLADCAPIREGVSYLTPSRKLKYFLGYQNWKNIPDDQMDVSLCITYENEVCKRFEHTVNFDFRQMSEVLSESFKDPSLRVAEAIKNYDEHRESNERMQHFLGPIRTLERRKMKMCPMCAEMIPAEARKCSHCQEMQDKTDSTIT